MFLILLNLSTLESINVNSSNRSNLEIKPVYFRFLQKICPIQEESGIKLDINKAILNF